MAQATLGAGSKLEISDMQATPAFTQIKGVIGIGETGEEGGFVDATAMEETTKEFIADIAEGPDKTVQVILNQADPGQQMLRDAARARQTVDFKLTLSDGTVGEFKIVLAGWKVAEPEGSGTLKAIATGKQSGATTWTDPA